MTILNQLKQDQLQARKDRNSSLAMFLTTLYSEAGRPGLDDGKRESTDAEVTAVIKKFIKNSEEVLANLAPSDERSVNAQAEIDTLNRYLPKQLTQDSLETIIRAEVVLHGFDSMKNLGAIMKFMKDKYDGRYDGKLASTVAKSQLLGNK